MLSLVDDLLLMAALDAGRLDLALRTVDLSALAAAVAADQAVAAARKGQEVTVEGADGVHVPADEARLRQVIENLMGNALKFSPPGGTVQVAVRAANGRARLEIRDQGPGLTAEDRARLFRAFTRLSARPTAGESSTGLGLSIVKELVELHGGQVSAESDGPETGTTFVVDLPLAAATLSDGEPGAQANS